ncbi:hypothetical protein ACI2KG_09380 [Pseudomonas sp. NPDC089407]|uniref:hypothetical protein n=1 Tax=Pseudomonas sp. NPDC089407 TaxID=3364464 RepID=UPI00384F8C9B
MLFAKPAHPDKLNLLCFPFPDASAAVFEQAPEREAVVGPRKTAGKARDRHRLSVICKP